jgi:hypothetical protein
MSNQMASFSVTRAASTKTLLVMTAIAAMVASPAFAQSARQLAMQDQAAAAALAAQTRSPSLNEVYRNSVYSNGEYVGADPDASIRLQLLTDAPNRTGGAD